MAELNKYKPYESYIVTSATWYKQKPAHWKCERFKYNFREKKKKNATDFPAGAISFGKVIFKNEENLSQDTKNSYQEVLAGEFLINPLNLNFDLKSLRTALSTINVVVSTGYIVLQGCGLLHPRFARWLLHQFDVSHMKTLGAGVRQTINYADIGDSIFCRPTYEEQKTIAVFLDHETAKIDNLIEKQKQLIELLKEKRQAVISHAVTKGLNTDVAMKDSCVEWLGQVPEHWEASRIGWLCNVGNGCTPSRENDLFWQNGSYPWLNSSKVNDERVITADQFITPKALSECSLPKVKKGSVIMAITGEGKTRGTSALMMIDATINQHIAYITPRTINKILPEFIHLWLQSKYQQIRTISAGWGSTKAAITCSDVKSYPIPVPPIKEQQEIVKIIEKEKNNFSNLLCICEKQIELLQERRTALISAAVTGKIDVRDWVAPDTNHIEASEEATA